MMNVLLELGKELVGNNYFQVKDNEMLGDRILEGDYVTIEKQGAFKPEDIILVFTNRPMLRRIKSIGVNYILSASNPVVSDEICNNFLIIGKVTQLVVKV